METAVVRADWPPLIMPSGWAAGAAPSTDMPGGGAAVAYGPGSTLVSAAGAEHAWANLGTEPPVFIATAIRKEN